MLDRTFLRPIAHRGLHAPHSDRIENSAPAFAAAIAKGYGIECDLQPASDGTPFVFHDFTLERLVEAQGRIAARTPAELEGLTYRGHDVALLSFAGLLDLVRGRVPLFVEIKSDWGPPDERFLRRIARLAKSYHGPLALMSFDPAAMVAMRRLAPNVPRGIVAGVYEGEGWWLKELGKERAFRLTNLLENGPVAPAFVSYHVKSLPTAVTRYIREVQGLSLICWTVRTAADRRRAAAWADAPTFEGYEP
jgi:glycerophosphoryl diester phosphodiesterase